MNLSVHPGRRSPHRPIPSGRLQPGLRACPSRAHTRTQSLTQAHTCTHAVTHTCAHTSNMDPHSPYTHSLASAHTHTHVYLTCMYMCTSYTDTFHIHAQVPHTDHTPVHTHSSDINTDHTRVHTSAGCKHVHTNKSTHVTGTSPHKCCPHTYHTHVDTRVHGAPLSYICRT